MTDSPVSQKNSFLYRNNGHCEASSRSRYWRYRADQPQRQISASQEHICVVSRLIEDSYQKHYRGPAQIAAETAGVAEPVNAEHTNGSKFITTNFGIPWPADGQHALNVGGLPVTSDPYLFEKQQTFVREKVVERRVHAAGSGHFGFFEVTKDVSHLTKAGFLSEVGKKTPLFLRFSTVTFGKEFPDLARNPRGFAIKLYTGEGNYDIVGLNWPIFFVRDVGLIDFRQTTADRALANARTRQHQKSKQKPKDKLH